MWVVHGLGPRIVVAPMRHDPEAQGIEGGAIGRVPVGGDHRAGEAVEALFEEEDPADSPHVLEEGHVVEALVGAAGRVAQMLPHHLVHRVGEGDGGVGRRELEDLPAVERPAQRVGVSRGLFGEGAHARTFGFSAITMQRGLSSVSASPFTLPTKRRRPKPTLSRRRPSSGGV